MGSFKQRDITSDNITKSDIKKAITEYLANLTLSSIEQIKTDIIGMLKGDGSGIVQAKEDVDYAPAAKGVTNGDTHDHVGGDGAQIDHGGLAGLTDDDHTQYIKHSLATAANDFLIASGSGVFAKQTLAEALVTLGKAVASGLASLDASSLVVQNPANATATPTASKIPIADESGKLNGWVDASAWEYHVPLLMETLAI